MDIMNDFNIIHPEPIIDNFNTTISDSNDYFNSLLRDSRTFTADRLQAILVNDRITYEYRNNPTIRAHTRNIYGPPSLACGVNIEYFWSEDRGDGITRWYTEPNAKLCLERFSRKLYGHKSRASISVNHLNRMYSKIFKFRFEPLDQSHDIVEKASGLLQRMPARPPELADCPTVFPTKYCGHSFNASYSKNTTLWEQLKVTSYVNDVVLRTVLVAITDPSYIHSILEIRDVTAALLETVSRLSSHVSNVKTAWRVFIVRAFLWNSWHRPQRLYFHLIAASHMKEGSADGKKERLTVRGTFPSPDISIDEMSEQCASSGKASYMCGWNFESLRTNHVCIGFDFRRFHWRYSTAFGDLNARCLSGQSNACMGENPQSCRRFRGMVVKDQSAHDLEFPKDCTQLVWDEEYCRCLAGGRAVLLTGNECLSNGKIQYCKTSDRTLAISHVWSQ